MVVGCGGQSKGAVGCCPDRKSGTAAGALAVEPAAQARLRPMASSVTGPNRRMAPLRAQALRFMPLVL